MDFGIFILMQQRNKHKTSHEILRDAVEQTRVADEVGFGGAWYAEHHFSNYGLCSSPLKLIAHCAAVTRMAPASPAPTCCVSTAAHRRLRCERPMSSLDISPKRLQNVHVMAERPAPAAP